MSVSSKHESSRDDRHIRLAQRMGIDEHAARTKFLGNTILLTGDHPTLLRPEGRTMALTAMNLIARFCPRIDVFMPWSPNLAQELTALGQAIDSSASAAYRVLSDIDDELKYKSVLSIGPTPVPSPVVTEITASGWLAGVSSSGPAPVLAEAWCGPGALAAAAIGASQVFIRLLEPLESAGGLSPSIVFSTYDLTARTDLRGLVTDSGPTVDNVELPTVLLGGCGAVGQAFFYSLLHLPIRAGLLWAVDHDRASLSNLNRCPLAFQGHIELSEPPLKVSLLEDAAKGTSLQVHADRRPLDEALKDPQTYPVGFPTIVVCGVDNAEARAELQRLWPDLFLEGSTGDAQLQVLRWAFGNDRACSFCYHSDVKTVDAPYHERMAIRSGLAPERISASLVAPDAVVTELDVVAAPADKQSFLVERKGQPICSVLSEIERFTQQQETPKEPSVSFTSFLTGVILAAEVLKHAANLPTRLDSQFLADTLFPLTRAEVIPLIPLSSCYCQKRKGTIAHFRQAVTSQGLGGSK